MGEVIALPPSRTIATSQPDGATAAILFFTGVRYYRMSEDEVAKLATPAPQRRAKTKGATPKIVSAKIVSAKIAPAKSASTKSAASASTKTAAPARKLRKLA